MQGVPRWCPWAVGLAGRLPWHRVASRGGGQRLPFPAKGPGFCSLSAFLCLFRNGAMQRPMSLLIHSISPALFPFVTVCPAVGRAIPTPLVFRHAYPCLQSSRARLPQRRAGRDRQRRAFRPSAPRARPQPLPSARAHQRALPPCRARRKAGPHRAGLSRASGCKVLQLASTLSTTACRQDRCLQSIK